MCEVFADDGFDLLYDSKEMAKFKTVVDYHRSFEKDSIRTKKLPKENKQMLETDGEIWYCEKPVW